MASTNISAPGLKLEVSNYQDKDGQVVVLRGYSADNYPTLSVYLAPAEAEVLAALLAAAVKSASASPAVEA